MFFQNKPRQQNRYGWIQRRDHDRFVEPPMLVGEDEQRAAADVEAPGQQAERGARTVEREWSASDRHGHGGGRERSDSGNRRDPGRRSAGLMNAKIEAREADSGKRR